jgi:hypothetical protein
MLTRFKRTLVYFNCLRFAMPADPTKYPRMFIHPYFEVGDSLAMCLCYISKTQNVQNCVGIVRAFPGSVWGSWDGLRGSWGLLGGS